MKNEITIGLPSKGRLRDKAISFFEENGFKILQSEKERNYFAIIENKPSVKIIYLHASKKIIRKVIFLKKEFTKQKFRDNYLKFLREAIEAKSIEIVNYIWMEPGFSMQ